MSLKQAPYYWLECDGLSEDGTVCAEKSTESSEYSAWVDEGSALEEATGSEWVRHGGKDYCETHNLQFRCDDCAEVKEECVCEAGCKGVEHKEIPASNGPGYCTGCDWQSRQIGISSTLQHAKHVEDVTP